MTNIKYADKGIFYYFKKGLFSEPSCNQITSNLMKPSFVLMLSISSPEKYLIFKIILCSDMAGMYDALFCDISKVFLT